MDTYMHTKVYVLLHHKRMIPYREKNMIVKMNEIFFHGIFIRSVELFENTNVLFLHINYSIITREKD